MPFYPRVTESRIRKYDSDVNIRILNSNKFTLDNKQQ